MNVYFCRDLLFPLDWNFEVPAVKAILKRVWHPPALLWFGHLGRNQGNAFWADCSLLLPLQCRWIQFKILLLHSLHIVQVPGLETWCTYWLQVSLGISQNLTWPCRTLNSIPIILNWQKITVSYSLVTMPCP